MLREHFPGTGDQRRFTGARWQQGKFDVPSPALFAAGHILGATNLPHRMISETTLAPYPKDRLVVVYCAGPHCNGANRAAVRLAELGRPVKEMIGGITGWQEEGFDPRKQRSQVPGQSSGKSSMMSAYAIYGGVPSNRNAKGENESQRGPEWLRC